VTQEKRPLAKIEGRPVVAEEEPLQQQLNLGASMSGQLVPSQVVVVEHSHFSDTEKDMLHALGCSFLDAIEESKGICLRKAELIWKAWSIYCRRGHEQKFGSWVSKYTDLSRTQAHRLRLVYECFVQAAMKCSSVEQPPDLAELEQTLANIKVTALYHLSSPTTPPAARLEAMEESKNAVITPARALEIIDKHTVPSFDVEKAQSSARSAKPRAKRRIIEVDGVGKVTVQAADGDLRKVLRAALKQLGRVR